MRLIWMRPEKQITSLNPTETIDSPISEISPQCHAEIATISQVCAAPRFDQCAAS